MSVTADWSPTSLTSGDVSLRSRLSIRAFTSAPLQLWAHIDFAANPALVFRTLSCPETMSMESSTNGDPCQGGNIVHSDEPWAHVVSGRKHCRGIDDFLAGMFFEPATNGGTRMIWQICFRSLNWRGRLAPYALSHEFNQRLIRLDERLGRRNGRLRLT